MGETHTALALRNVAIAGGAAGDHTVTGIKPQDKLISVIDLDPADGGAGISGLVDLTSEFTITAVDTINNVGGTASNFLTVLYIAASPTGGDLNQS